MKQTEQSATDNHASESLTSTEDSVEVRNQFQLEGLEPRILLSGDPVLAELARVLDTNDQADAAHQPAAIVYELEADLKSDLGLGAERDPSVDLIEAEASAAPSVEWPEGWQTAATSSADEAEIEATVEAKTESETEIQAATAADESAPSEGIVPVTAALIAAASTTESQTKASGNASDFDVIDASNEVSLASTESKKSVDVNDDSIARAPPVYQSIQSDSDSAVTDAIAAGVTAFTYSAAIAPAQAPEDAEIERAPPVEDDQPRAPPVDETDDEVSFTGDTNNAHQDGAKDFLFFDGAAVADDGAASLTTDQLDLIFQQAILLWSEFAPDQAALLATITTSITDLPDAQLGATAGNAIAIDATAAGHGWFVDTTPAENSEFADPFATPDGVDLLTALLHEIGHVLGYTHGAAGLEEVMADALGAGERYPLDADPIIQAFASVLPEDSNLNDVINDLLAGFSTISPPADNTAFTSTSGDLPNAITVGSTLFGGEDLEITDVTLTFYSLAYVSGSWTGQVTVEATAATLFPGLLNIVITDDGSDTSAGHDPDSFAVAGIINLALGNGESFLQLDDLDAADIGWPAILDIAITDLRLEFTDFRTNDNNNILSLDAAFLGIDTGNSTINDLLAADNPLFGLSVEGFVDDLKFNMGELEKGVKDASSGNISFPTSPILELSGVGGQISGKLFSVGSLTAGFILQEVTADPDGSGGPKPEQSAVYIAVNGQLSLGPSIAGDEGFASFQIAFAMSELGPLQFFFSLDVPIMIEPTTGLAISSLRAGVRFNTTIEELQSEVDFFATAAEYQLVAGLATRVTLTIPDHDLVIGNDFRVFNSTSDKYEGQFTVLSVNGDDVTYEIGVDEDPEVFVGSADITRLTITDPFDLRDSGLNAGVAPPASIIEWRDQLNQAVINQILAGGNVWALLFEKVTIGGGASMSFDPRIPDYVLSLDVDVLIDTQLRIFMKGGLNILDGLVSFPARMYADLSDLFSGSGRFLFLADIPELPFGDVEPLLVYRGEVSFEALFGNDVLDAMVTQNGSEWEVELEIAADNPSEEYDIGDFAFVNPLDSSATDPNPFDGRYEVIGVSDIDNTITLRYLTDPGVWAAGSLVKVHNEKAVAGFRIALEGGVDVNVPGVDAGLNPITLTTLTLEGSVAITFTVAAPTAAYDVAMELVFTAMLSETNIGSIAMASGRFTATINADPLKVEIFGAAVFSTNLTILENVGLFITASGLLRINTSDAIKPAITLDVAGGGTVDVELPAKSFALRLDGGVDFRIDFDIDGFDSGDSVFEIAGIFVLEFSQQGFNVAVFKDDNGSVVPAILRLGPKGSPLLEFEVLGFLSIRDTGLAASLVLSTQRNLPFDLASMDATAVFILNTTGEEVVFDIPGGATDPNRPTGLAMVIPAAAPANPSAILNAPGPSPGSSGLDVFKTGSPTWVEGAAGPYGILLMDGSVSLLSILNFELSGYVLLSKSVVSLEANFYAGGDFLGLASGSVSGSLFFSSQGEFVLDLGASVQLGPDWLNINGSADLLISYLDSDGKGSIGTGDKKLAVKGKLYVAVTVDIDPVPAFDILSVELTVKYENGVITVNVPYPEPYWNSACKWGICVYWPDVRTAHLPITVGTLDIAPEPPAVLGQVDGNGVLTINAGDSAARTLRDLLVDEINEDVTIGANGAVSGGRQEITVTMFGLTQTFKDVRRIEIADMDDGSDVVVILGPVGIPTQVRFGSGNDRLTNFGFGTVKAYGDEGDDQLAGGSAGDYLYGGLGHDFINGGSGQDVIEGGDDNDSLTGGLDADTIRGGSGADFIVGDLAERNTDATGGVVESKASASSGGDTLYGDEGDDIILGGGGNDTITGGIGDDRIFGDDARVTFVDGDPQPVFALLNLGYAGNDTVKWFVGDGDDNIEGGTGSDILEVVGTDANAEQIQVAANGTGFTAGIGAELINADGVETAAIDGKGAADSFTVNDLGSSLLQLVNLKLGSDSVADAVIINGTNVAEAYVVSSVAAALRIAKTGGATIDVFDAGENAAGDAITLHTAGGNDTVNIQATLGGTVTRINGDAGNDTFNVGSAAPASGVLDQINGRLVLDGGANDDTLNFDDTSDVTGDTGQLGFDSLTGLGMAVGADYFNIEELDIALGSGGDTFTVASTHAGKISLATGSGADVVHIQSVAGTTLVNTADGSDTVNVQSVAAETTITTGNDNDTVNVQSINAKTTVSTGNDNDTINVLSINAELRALAGNDDDTINVGSMAPATGGTLNAINAIIHVDGGSGSDALNIDDSGDTANEMGSLTDWTLWGLGMTVGLCYFEFEMLDIGLGSGNVMFIFMNTHRGSTTLRTNAGADMINVRHIEGATTIAAGSGDDTVNVGSNAPGTSGVLQMINAPLILDGGADFDALNVDNSGDTGPIDIVLSANMITGLGMSDGITYSNFEELDLGLGSGPANMLIDGTHSGTTSINFSDSEDAVNVRATGGLLRLFMNGGSDTLNIGSLAPAQGGTLNNILGLIELDGGAGTDFLNVDDTGDTGANAGELTATALTGFGMEKGIVYTTIELLGVALGSGEDTLAVSGSMRGSDGFQRLTYVTTGGGNDIVSISLQEGVDGFFVLNTEAGNDFVDGAASTQALIIAGGQGDDTIGGGTAKDFLFGDRALVSYDDGVVQANALNGNPIYAGLITGPFINGLQLMPASIESIDPEIGGNDVLSGNGGDDLIIGGSGSDMLRGGSGRDLLLGDNVALMLSDGDVVGLDRDSLPEHTLELPGLKLTYVGTGGDDSLEGGTGNDLMLGQGGNDTYVFAGGGLGADTLLEAGEPRGESGNGPSYPIHIDAPNDDHDTLDFSEFIGPVNIKLADIYKQKINHDTYEGEINLELTIGMRNSIENVIGSEFDDMILGNDRDNRLEGRGGDDKMYGKKGHDSLYGGAGKDLLIGKNSGDFLDQGA